MAPSRSPSSAGRLLGHYVRGLVLGDGSPSAAAAFLAGQPGSEAAEAARILRASVGAISSADLLAATHPVGADLALLMRGQSLIDRIPGWRRVPFRTRVFSQLAGTRAKFVAAGAALPVFAMGIDDARSLQPAKVGAITTQTHELFSQSPALADELVPADLAAACAAGIDERFLDITSVPSDDSPGFVGHGAELLVSGGSDVAAIDADLRAMLATITASGHSLRTACWITSSRTVAYLATLRSGDALAFPGVTASGGLLMGLPVLATPQAPLIGSPQETIIVLLVGEALRVADDNVAEIEISKRAALAMNDAPTANGVTPTASTVVSLYQSSAVAVKATRFCNWRLADTSACATLVGVNF